MDVLDSFIDRVTDAILLPLITVAALVAFALFVWGVVLFIASSDNEEKRATGKSHMVWGIVGLTILFGASIIVDFLKNVIGG